MLAKHGLSSDLGQFKLLGQGPFDLHGFNGGRIDEAKRFQETVIGLARSGFLEAEIENIFDVLVALLKVALDPLRLYTSFRPG